MKQQLQDTGHQVTEDNDPRENEDRWGEPDSCPGLLSKAQGRRNHAEPNSFPELRWQNGARPGKVEFSGRTPERRDTEATPALQRVPTECSAEYWTAHVHEAGVYLRLEKEPFKGLEKQYPLLPESQEECPSPAIRLQKSIILEFSDKSCLSSEE